MSRGINKVILLGNLGKDPIIKYRPDGMAVATISIATSRNQKNQLTGAYEEVTDWHYVTLYAKLAEVAGQYLKKGSKVYVEGFIKTSKWDDNGVERSRTGIVGKEMQMISSNNTSSVSYNSPENSAVSNKFAHQNDDFSFDDDVPF